MGKTWFALAAVLLAWGAVVHAADPARGVASREPSFATEYQPSAPALAPAPADAHPAPGPAPSATPAGPSAPAKLALEAAPAAPVAPCCTSCGAGEAPAGPTRFPCVNRFIDWATYRPLHLGVKCATCCDDKGDCCRFHCAPPLYMFFLDHCKEGTPPAVPACTNTVKDCGCCAHDCRFWFPGQRLLFLRTGFGCGSAGCH
jgi:hypothetical protein